jgi:hypothetical protein
MKFADKKIEGKSKREDKKKKRWTNIY